MLVPVDYSSLANIAPAVPLLFLVPFALYVFSMPIGAMALATRHRWRDEPLWVKVFAAFGVVALHYFPYAMFFWLIALDVITTLIGAHTWQVLALHAMLFGSAAGSYYIWGRALIPR